MNNGKCELKHKGFLYELYIEGKFIEYFDTIESAKSFLDESMSAYKGANYFIKPCAYFTTVEVEKP